RRESHRFREGIFGRRACARRQRVQAWALRGGVARRQGLGRDFVTTFIDYARGGERYRVANTVALRWSRRCRARERISDTAANCSTEQKLDDCDGFHVFLSCR